MEAGFTRVTIIGTGLIGGSVGLALRASGFAGSITGCDNTQVLRKAVERGAIDIAEPQSASAVRDADLVILATPIGATLELLPQVAHSTGPETLVTDTGSTKAAICRRVAEVFGASGAQRFVGGHPIAGKECSGVEHSDAGLFRGNTWVLTPAGDGGDEPARRLGAFVELLGARVLRLSPEEHDLALAFTSHLPQVVSWALVEAAREGLPAKLCEEPVTGPGWRDMTRLSHSPPELWRDVFRTNSDNIVRALELMEEALRRARQKILRQDDGKPAAGIK